MKEKLIEFLELENQKTATDKLIFNDECLSVAPLAVRKLLEAAELLEKVITPKENVLDERVLRDDIKQFLEDFNNEN